jgi:carbamoylphosphate synthase large subunit
VPLSIAEMKYLDAYRHLLINNPIPLPQLDVICLCDDKYKLNQMLIENGFAAFIPPMGLNLNYPYILKKRIDEWGVNSHIVHNAEQALLHADLIGDKDYFCQDLILGNEEYTTHILFKNHRITCMINLQFSFAANKPIKGKDAIISSASVPFRYNKIFSAILDSIGFEGLCCINYKIVNGKPLIFEINPRFGGSLGEVFYFFADHIEGAQDQII